MQDFWMGPDGIVSQLHADSSDNILVMIDGTKKFVVFPPTDKEYLYPNYGIDFVSAAQC